MSELVASIPLATLGLSLGVLLAAFTVLWVVSVALRDSSIIDIAWGPAFLLLAGVAAASAPALGAGSLLLLGMVALWAARLAGYLAWRNLGKGEDPRYRAMRASAGPRWWWLSLFVVFWLQAGIAWVVSLPLQLALASGTAAPTQWLAPGVLTFAVGLLFETVGDLQLARFKADPANRGQVMDRGLWRYTRHPNYFGDFCVTWGFFGVALASGAPPWTAIGPVLMTYLLLRVSGVTLLERSLRATKPGYDAYVRRTSAFFPRPPRAS